MKKFYLMLLAGSIGVSAQAQEAIQKGTINFKPAAGVEELSGKAAVYNQIQPRNVANKGTAIVKREYSIVDMRYQLDPSIADSTSLPYMWGSPNGMGIYQGASGLELDTITLTSVFNVLHPFYATFNDANAYPGEPTLTNTDAYKLDSVYVRGVYGRNPTKPNVVDTLVIAATYGGTTTHRNLPIYYYGPSATHADTVFTAIPFWFANRNHLTDSVGGLSKVTVVKHLLTSASLNDTDANGWSVFKVPVNMNVPAGNLLGVSYTFKSGDTYVAGDTVFAGSATPTRPFKYGMFRPLFYGAFAAKYPTYYKSPRDYNTSGIQLTPPSANYPDSYIPVWAFTPAFTMEWADMSFVLSWDKLISVKEKASELENSAFPNPANDVLKLTFTPKSTSDVNITVTNVSGQKVMTMPVGRVSANTTKAATINTSGLSNGVYFYTIEAGTERSTRRFVVTH